MPISTITSNSLGGSPAFSAYQSASITLTAGTNVLISVQTKEFDTNTCYNNTNLPVTLNGLSVPAFAFMPNIAGYYQVNARFGANAGIGQFVINIYKNGTVYKAGINSPTMYAPNVSSVVYLNGTTDYIQIYGYSANGDTTVNGISTTWFNAVMVRGV